MTPKMNFLHDAGHAIKRGKTSILDDLRFKYHVVYSADGHHILLPNDNKLYGCRSIWKEEY